MKVELLRSGVYPWFGHILFFEAYVNGTKSAVQDHNDPDLFEAKENTIQSNNDSEAIRVYPNPTNDYIYIESNEEVEISIFDFEGRKVRELTKDNSARKMKILLQGLSSGTYLVIASSEENVFRTKLIVQ